MDNLGAKLVGTKTHGKWNAQIIEDLPNHFAVKFTTNLFKSPKNKSYQGVGMKPDVEVSASDINSTKTLANDSSLRAAFNLLKASQI